MRYRVLLAALAGLLLGPALPAWAGPFFFSTGNPDGRMATGSRPDSPSGIEIESADDFLLTRTTIINHATFVGLLPPGANVRQVRVEIYQVFPFDSNTSRTPNVPTRTNSPSDVVFADRDSAVHNLSFHPSLLSSNFTAANSVLNGIHPSPNQTTGGEGPVTGDEVQFDVTFGRAFTLPADHYFFIPQVLLDDGNFLWLSAPKPIVSPGTPFSPDLQSWIRNADLDPDWLRIATDIVGGDPKFNATFSLSGQSVPEPGSLALAMMGGVGLGAGWVYRRRS